MERQRAKKAVRRVRTAAHEDPSAASVAEIPEVDVAKAKLIRRGPRAVGSRPATLKLLRIGAEKTQSAVAEASGIAQSEISNLERGSLRERQLSTIERYVAALGGKLELVAVFPNGERMHVVSPED